MDVQPLSTLSTLIDTDVDLGFRCFDLNCRFANFATLNPLCGWAGSDLLGAASAMPPYLFLNYNSWARIPSLFFLFGPSF